MKIDDDEPLRSVTGKPPKAEGTTSQVGTRSTMSGARLSFSGYSKKSTDEGK